jgi:hypothetical protein
MVEYRHAAVKVLIRQPAKMPFQTEALGFSAIELKPPSGAEIRQEGRTFARPSIVPATTTAPPPNWIEAGLAFNSKVAPEKLPSNC